MSDLARHSVAPSVPAVLEQALETLERMALGHVMRYGSGHARAILDELARLARENAEKDKRADRFQRQQAGDAKTAHLWLTRATAAEDRVAALETALREIAGLSWTDRSWRDGLWEAQRLAAAALVGEQAAERKVPTPSEVFADLDALGSALKAREQAAEPEHDEIMESVLREMIPDEAEQAVHRYAQAHGVSLNEARSVVARSSENDDTRGEFGGLFYEVAGPRPDHDLNALARTLFEHALVGIQCDEDGKRDRPSCACSMIDLGWWPSVGAARQAWVDHVMALVRGHASMSEILRRADASPGVLPADEPEREQAQ